MEQDDNGHRATYVPGHPTNLALTLGSLRHGSGDPTIRRDGSAFWRATRTPNGPAVQRLEQAGAQIEMTAWGPGSTWLGDHLGILLGQRDTGPAAPFGNPLVDGWFRQRPDVRTPCTLAVWEALLPAILEQKVTGTEAWDSYRRLHFEIGEHAPTPPGAPRLYLPLDPAVVAGTPAHVFMRCNVEQKRSRTIRICAEYARRVEETIDMPGDAARARLAALPGVGRWTVAEVATRALGDADAVSVGDFHLKNVVAWNLAGRPRGTDDEMLELLEPFRPYRGRVLQLMQIAGSTPPKYGPRLTIQKRW